MCFLGKQTRGVLSRQTLCSHAQLSENRGKQEGKLKREEEGKCGGGVHVCGECGVHPLNTEGESECEVFLTGGKCQCVRGWKI